MQQMVSDTHTKVATTKGSVVAITYGVGSTECEMVPAFSVNVCQLTRSLLSIQV